MRTPVTLSQVAMVMALLAAGCPLPALGPNDDGGQDTFGDRIGPIDGPDLQGPDQPDADRPDLPADLTADAVDPSTTLHVDGLAGTDGASGTPDDPYRSISEALRAARNLEGFVTLQVRGAGDGSPAIEYSGSATGETFPLVPRAGVAITVLPGESAFVRGDGPCDEDVGCTFLIDDAVGQPRTELANLTVLSTGYGVIVRQRAQAYFENLFLRDDLTSLLVRDQAEVEGRGLTSENSGTEGIWVRDAARVTLVDAMVVMAGSGALVVEGTGAVISTDSCTFARSGPGSQGNRGGVLISGEVTWTSSSDQFLSNVVDGVALAGQNGEPVVTMTGARIQGNGDDGVFAACGETAAPCLTLRSSTVTGNMGAGIMVGDGVTVDLGTEASPGANVMHDPAAPNTEAALCTNGGGQTIPAFGNTWSQCGPGVNAMCVNGVDLGGTRAINSGGCSPSQ